jgi:hypothetical protein
VLALVLLDRPQKQRSTAQEILQLELVSDDNARLEDSMEKIAHVMLTQSSAGIQNFPEGLAVSLPLHASGFSLAKSFWYGQLSGMVEPIFGVLGELFLIKVIVRVTQVKNLNTFAKKKLIFLFFFHHCRCSRCVSGNNDLANRLGIRCWRNDLHCGRRHNPGGSLEWQWNDFNVGLYHRLCRHDVP